MIIRRRTEINGYIGAYGGESNAKPSYQVDILKKTCFGTRIIRRYYMVYHVYRSIGFKEPNLGLPSVAKEYGEVTSLEYKFMSKINHSLLHYSSRSFITL